MRLATSTIFNTVSDGSVQCVIGTQEMTVLLHSCTYRFYPYLYILCIWWQRVIAAVHACVHVLYTMNLKLAEKLNQNACTCTKLALCHILCLIIIHNDKQQLCMGMPLCDMYAITAYSHIILYNLYVDCIMCTKCSKCVYIYIAIYSDGFDMYYVCAC